MRKKIENIGDMKTVCKEEVRKRSEVVENVFTISMTVLLEKFMD